VILLLLEPDLGTSMVMVGIFVSAYWSGGGRLRHLILIAGALGLALVAVTVFEAYRVSRLIAFKNPWADPLGSGFQATSRCASPRRLVRRGHPATRRSTGGCGSHRLHLRAIVGEETELIGTSLVMLGFWCFHRGYRASLRAPDRSGMALAARSRPGCFRGAAQHGHGHQHAAVTGVPLPFQLRRAALRDTCGRGILRASRAMVRAQH
jgi:cell division protein FtsW